VSISVTYRMMIMPYVSSALIRNSVMHAVVTKHKTGHVACLYRYQVGNFSGVDTSAHLERHGLMINKFFIHLFLGGGKVNF
jgi:hypothetical protein